jgi:hypothetical protein
MAALNTGIYLTPPYSIASGPFGAVTAGTAPTTNAFTGLVTFPIAVEILGFSMNRGSNGAPTSGMTFTCGYAAPGTSAAGGVTACGAAFTDVAAIGLQQHVINDNGITGTDPKAAKPIVVPAGQSIGFLASNHATTNSLFNGYTILYRPAQ